MEKNASSSSSSRVCVTGASGYIGSLLVKKLLERGHTVHATLRNSGDESKVGILRRLSGAEDRLVLFQANIFSPDEFEPAIRGCDFVFHVAAPVQINDTLNLKNEDGTDPNVASVRKILRVCEQSGTVRRVIYTGSVTAASPLKEDGSGFKDFIDETCWTPLNIMFAHCEDYAKSYTHSKTLSEKELLQYQYKEVDNRMEIVSLASGLVGGDALLPTEPNSVQVVVSPLTGDSLCYKQLKFLEALLGSVPIVHIDDVCDAHIFCMEKSSLTGRFLCASDYPTMREFLEYYELKYPELNVTKETEGTDRKIPCNSQKLVDAGFRYKYGMEQIFDDSVKCVKRLGGLKESKLPDL